MGGTAPLRLVHTPPRAGCVPKGGRMDTEELRSIEIDLEMALLNACGFVQNARRKPQGKRDGESQEKRPMPSVPRLLNDCRLAILFQLFAFSQSLQVELRVLSEGVSIPTLLHSIKHQFAPAQNPPPQPAGLGDQNRPANHRP